MTLPSASACKHIGGTPSKTHLLRGPTRVIIMCEQCWQMVCEKADIKTLNIIMQHKSPGRGT